MDHSPHHTDPQTNGIWKILGVDVSRSLVTFLCQIFVLYACILTCLLNLTMTNGPKELWITLLSMSLGTILPSPKVPSRQRLIMPSTSSQGQDNTLNAQRDRRTFMT